MEGLGFHGWTDSEILDAQNIHQHSFETNSWNINGRIENHTVKVILVSIMHTSDILYIHFKGKVNFLHFAQ